MTRRARWCRRLTWLLVGAIAVLAFARSFEAIADYARQLGWGDVMCYVAPLLVDTFTVAAMLVILVRAWEHVRAVYAWVLLVGASVVSVALNVAHADPNPEAQVFAALPPVALLAAVELAMSEARRDRDPVVVLAREAATLAAEAAVWAARAVALAARARTISLPQQDVARVPVRVASARRPEDRARPRAITQPNARLTTTQVAQVESWVGQGRTNKSWMARELGLSDRGRKHLGRLVDDLLATQNGERPKEPAR